MIKRFFNNNINRIFLLEVTAYPGFYKVIILFFIKYFHSTQIVGNYVNDTSYAMIFGFFTYVNFSNYIIKYIPPLEPDEKKQFLNFLIKKVLWASIVFAVIGIALYYFKLITDCIGFIVFMIAYSMYNVLRYYYIVEKTYARLVLLETILLLLTFVTVYASPHNKVLLINGICFFVFSLYVLFDLKLYRHLTISAHLKQLVNLPLSLNYGIINAASSGLYLILGPISFKLLNSDYTALIGIINNLTSILLIFTRSLSYHFMPLMSLNIANKDMLKKFVSKFNNYMFKLLIGGFIVCFIGICLMGKANLKIDILHLKDAIYITILFLIATVVSQFALPSSNLLILVNKQRFLLRINLYQLAIFLLAAFVLIQFHLFEGVVVFNVIMYVLIVVNLLKYLWLNRVEKFVLNTPKI